MSIIIVGKRPVFIHAVFKWHDNNTVSIRNRFWHGID